ncbi:hypothetical protein [Limosilactobacillus albertensis]|uniref:hypothetical protein n=1 Tax=Limosilactobacillus albertensis TaxID=2759752 RepID=UPI001E403F71|nr:hypothetical protein [Limosilactobacillus albertensis]
MNFVNTALSIIASILAIYSNFESKKTKKKLRKLEENIMTNNVKNGNDNVQINGNKNITR